MEKIVIKEGVEWDNEVYLHEQSAEAQEWYQENIAGLLSFNIAKELKERYLKDNNLLGIVPDEPETGGYKPIEIDAFCRPSVWEFEYDGLMVRIQYEYMDQSTAWRMNKIHVKIYEDA